MPDVSILYDFVGTHRFKTQIPSDINVCGANRSMSKIIHRCAVCRSRRGKQLVVPTGPLHMNSAPSASFERIAVDGFGPFHLKNGRKFWGIVVVCLSSRCVRITVLENLTFSSAIPSLMFVWNSVGRPNLVITDNGSHSSFLIYENPRSLSVYNPHNILCIVTHCFVSAWSWSPVKTCYVYLFRYLLLIWLFFSFLIKILFSKV